MTDTAALFKIADSLALIAGGLESLVYLAIAGLLTFFAFKKDSGFLYIIATAVLTFLAIYWLTTYQNILGLAFTVLLASGAAYVGYYAWQHHARRGASK